MAAKGFLSIQGLQWFLSEGRKVITEHVEGRALT